MLEIAMFLSFHFPRCGGEVSWPRPIRLCIGLAICGCNNFSSSTHRLAFAEVIVGFYHPSIQ